MMQLVSGMKLDIHSPTLFVLTYDGVPRILNLPAGKHSDGTLGNGNHKPPLPHKSNRRGRTLDLNTAVMPTDLEWYSWSQACLTTDLLRDDQTTRRIHG